MRERHRFYCLAVLGVFLLGSSSAQQAAVQWQPTLETTKRMAAQTGRLVLIHFWGDGCGPCQVMERDVFSRGDVAAAINRNYVAIKVNRSHFPGSAKHYGVSAVPADVIITPGGQLIDRHIGGLSASAYMSRLNQVASNSRGASPAPQYARNSPPPPRDSAAPSFGARPGYEPPGSASVVAYGRPPAPRRPENGIAARAPQRQVQAPPAMDQRPPHVAAAGARNLQSAARGAQPPASGYGQKPFQPSELPYSPQLADNAALPYQPEPSQWTHSPQPPPYTSGHSPTSSDVGGSTSSQPGIRIAAQHSPPVHESQRRPAPVEQPTMEIPPGNPPVALDGYCPVQLTEKNQWVLGNRRWGLRHEGRTYLFAGPDEKRRFNERPDKYAPVMSGNDVVRLIDGRQTMSGRREYGAWFMDRMFLFSDESTFQKFEANPDYYAGAIARSVSNVADRSAAPPLSPRPWERRN